MPNLRSLGKAGTIKGFIISAAVSHVLQDRAVLNHFHFNLYQHARQSINGFAFMGLVSILHALTSKPIFDSGSTGFFSNVYAAQKQKGPWSLKK